MAVRIGILDYGMGNLGSVENACRYLGMHARVIRTGQEMEECSHLIVPGVGGFRDCVAQLDKAELKQPLQAWIQDGRPYLGICLGLQVLFGDSEESPGTSGLGIFAGRVRRFPGGPGLKVPQIGWNQVWWKPACPLFEGISDGEWFYFVHSYYADPDDKGIVSGETEYGIRYTSAVWSGNVYAVQFHPERSHEAGLKVLRNFGRME